MDFGDASGLRTATVPDVQKGSRRRRSRREGKNGSASRHPGVLGRQDSADTLASTYRIDLSSNDRMIVRIVEALDCRVIDFAVIQQVRAVARWLDVVKIDSAHGTIHRHRYTLRGDGADRAARSGQRASLRTRCFQGTERHAGRLGTKQEEVARWRLNRNGFESLARLRSL